MGLGETCPGSNITQYNISFQTRSYVVTENVSIAECAAGKCNHTFVPPSNSPSSYNSVSVAAENKVGAGDAKTCTTQTISESYNFTSLTVITCISLANMCMFY